VDAPLALYRRYRPETFAEVIGQEHVTAPLMAALRHNRVNHAYLFSGPRGCGKTTSARILARALNCEQGPTDTPCGTCQSCVDLSRGGSGSMDVIEIDAASHGGVDDARDLRERAFFAPVSSRYKVYIIDEAHMVTTAGFNALLKLVEEPPPHLRFIFATTEPEKVIATIRSRTHHYPFRLIPPRTLAAYLGEICASEGVAIEPAALPLVVRAGGGSARDTLSVLDQLIGGSDENGVTYELTTSLLGFTPDTLLDEVVDAFAAQDGRTVFGVIDKIIETGQDPRRFTEDLLRRLRDLVIIAAVPDAPASGLIDVPEDQAERLVAQAARFGRADLSRAADTVAEGLTELRGATAPRLLLELICARVLLPGADHSTQGVMARLDRLEKRMSIEGVSSVAQPVAASAAPPVAPTAPVQATAPTVRPAAVAAPTPAPAPPAAPVVGEPVAAEPEPAPPAEPTPVAPAAETVPPSPSAPIPATGGMGLVDMRRIWPDAIESVKQRRRVAWMLLSQGAQIVDVSDQVLTIGFSNTGARDMFFNSGHDEVLRQVLIDLIGREWKLEGIVDPTASTAGPSVTVTKPAAASAPIERKPAAPSEAMATAREAIAPMREPGTPDETPEDTRDDHVDRNDPDADSLNGAELIQQTLGGTVIEEITHD
jgi:DNA polymerase-3 subunit gamma/tau